MDKMVKAGLVDNFNDESSEYSVLDPGQVQEKEWALEHMEKLLGMISKIEKEEFDRERFEADRELELQRIENDKEKERLKYELELKNIKNDKDKEKLKYELELQKIEIEKLKAMVEKDSLKSKISRDRIEKIINVSIKVIEVALPAALSIFMWYGQNRLIYIDDGRATPELKEVIRSVNKKIF